MLLRLGDDKVSFSTPLLVGLVCLPPFYQFRGRRLFGLSTSVVLGLERVRVGLSCENSGCEDGILSALGLLQVDSFLNLLGDSATRLAFLDSFTKFTNLAQR